MRPENRSPMSLRLVAAGLVVASWSAAAPAEPPPEPLPPPAVHQAAPWSVGVPGEGPAAAINTGANGWPQDVTIMPAPPTQCRRVPPGAIPVTSGSYVRQWEATERAKAAADAFVIYGHEWYQGGLDLGPYGRYHLNLIAQRLPGVPFAVVIQPDLREEYNAARRQLVIHYLARHGVADAAQRVVIAFPQAEGLYGEEAPRIYREFFGQGFGGGAYGATGFGTGGLGGFAPSGGVGGSLGGFGGTMGGFGSFR